MQFHHVALNYANRDSGAAAIFLSAIPTMELSRCVPIVDVRIISRHKVFEEFAGQNFTGDGISLFKFLEGRQPIVEDTVAGKMLLAQPAEILSPGLFDTTEIGNTTAAGMEIFTSPQTLVNADELYHDLGSDVTTDEMGKLVPRRKTSVIDKFKPFMTLSSFELEVVPSTGTLSTKNATLTFVLHDRSRLQDIKDLITPGGLGNVELLVEYGWKHPDPTTPYGALLDSMRSKEKFGVMNSSYSFDANGEVQVTLKLYSKGAHDVMFRLISDSGDGTSPYGQMKEIIDAINDAKRKIKGFAGDTMGDIFADTQLGKVNSVGALMKMKEKDLKKLRRDIQGINTAGTGKMAEAQKSLASNLTNALDSLGSYKDAIRDQIENLFAAVRNNVDPFIKPKNFTQTGNIDNTTHVSFAKLASIFIAAPIAETRKFDEIQLMLSNERIFQFCSR